MEILRKGIVSAQFRANHPKLCGNCVLPQNFNTRKLGEITVFYVVTFRKTRALRHEKLQSYKLQITFSLANMAI